MLLRGGPAFAKVGRDSSLREVSTLCSPGVGQSPLRGQKVPRQLHDCLTRPAAIHLLVDGVPLPETVRRSSRRASVLRREPLVLRRTYPPACSPPPERSSNTGPLVQRPCLGKRPVPLAAAEVPVPIAPVVASRLRHIACRMHARV